MYEKRTLPNGVRMVYEHMPHVRSAAIGVWIGVGSRYESPSNAGSAHFIEHMLFKGTAQHTASELAERMDGLGGVLRRKLIRGEGNNRFVEGFVNASVLFCVGAMAINGSMEAGMNHNYDIIISKAVIDGVTSITFAAAMGVGVAFSALPILAYQGGLTLIFSLVGQGIAPEIVTEMSAVGGTIIVGIGINMLGLPKEKIRVGNMLPAIFLPLVYLPAAQWLSGLIG